MQVSVVSFRVPLTWQLPGPLRSVHSRSLGHFYTNTDPHTRCISVEDFPIWVATGLEKRTEEPEVHGAGFVHRTSTSLVAMTCKNVKNGTLSSSTSDNSNGDVAHRPHSRVKNALLLAPESVRRLLCGLHYDFGQRPYEQSPAPSTIPRRFSPCPTWKGSRMPIQPAPRSAASMSASVSESSSFNVLRLSTTRDNNAEVGGDTSCEKGTMLLEVFFFYRHKDGSQSVTSHCNSRATPSVSVVLVDLM